MRVVVLQSNYIPWKGYFDLLKSADLFVVYDSVQYTKNDWRNRNQLLGPNGPIWLTIPVQTAGQATQKISETTVKDGRWARKHWMTTVQALGKRPHFASYRDEWQSWFATAGDLDNLHEINLIFLRGLARQLSIDTSIVNDTDFEFASDAGTATERLVSLCESVGCTTYITGPAGLDYMNLSEFEQAGIAVEVIAYDQYPTYPQLLEPFSHYVSALDLLANVGADAVSHLASVTHSVETS